MDADDQANGRRRGAGAAGAPRSPGGGAWSERPGLRGKIVAGRRPAKKNFIFGWTIAQWLVILISSLTQPQTTAATVAGSEGTGAEVQVDTELAMTRREFQAMRRELAALLQRAEAQQEEYRRLQVSAAALVAGAEAPEQRLAAAELLAVLAEVKQAGQALVTELIEVCRMLDAALDAETMPAAERARIRARLAGLRATGERFGARIRAPEELGGPVATCRILAVDDRLQVVVLAAGSVQGIGCGLGLRAGGGATTVRLRVIAVRPQVSAALVVEGDLDQLATGMMAQVGERSGDEKQ